MPSPAKSSPARGLAAPGGVAAAGDSSGNDLADPHLHEVVEHLGGALADAGMARLPARMFAALMATEDGRLTSAELSTVLEVSPAGVSGAVRYLTQVRMIRRERERGSRRDVYVVMDDAWHDVLMQTDQIYRPILAALAEARGVLGEDTRAGERMQLSVEFMEFVTREWSGIAQRWDEYKAARG
jgi:DNA-binding transcriptional regulator GbsR (MarR family)